MNKLIKTGKRVSILTAILIIFTLITMAIPAYAKLVKSVAIATSPSPPDGFIGNTFGMRCTVSTKGGPQSNMNVYWQYCSGEGCSNFVTIPTSGSGITCEASGCSYYGTTNDYSGTKTIMMNTIGHYRLRCYTNDTKGNTATSSINELTVSKYGWLNVNLLSPTDPTNVNQYNNFWINASLTCEGGDFAKCGSVYGSARYNENGTTPNTLISTTQGATPFYLIGGGSSTGGNELLIGVGNKELWFENQSGSYVNTWSSSDYGKGLENIAVGDTDDDGYNEMLLGFLSWNTTVIYENETGSLVNTYNKSYPSTLGSNQRFAIADIDNDGKNDNFAVTEWTNLSVYKYNGAGYDRIWTRLLASGSAYAFDAGDMDGDGKVEMVYALTTSPYTMMVFKNQSGTFVNTFNVTPADYVNNIDVGDADNDGVNDNFITCSNDNKVHLYKNSSGSLTEVWTSADIGDDIEDCNIGDVNDDGKNEIVAATGATNHSALVWENKSGTISLVYSYDIGGACDYHGVSIGDIDNDGKNNNFAVGQAATTSSKSRGSASSYYIRIFTYGTSYSVAWSKSYTTAIWGVTIGDPDNDGTDGATEAQNTKSCGTLNYGNICQLDWLVNATGTYNSTWKVDAKFVSSYGNSNVPDNDTSDSTVSIL